MEESDLLGNQGKSTVSDPGTDGGGRAPQDVESDAFLRFVGLKKSYDRKVLVVKDFDLDVSRWPPVASRPPTPGVAKCSATARQGFPRENPWRG